MDGDRNTPFFHNKACNRTARNRISGLNDEHVVFVKLNKLDSIQKILLDYLIWENFS